MKKGTFSSHIISLIIIAITEYIIFSIDAGSVVTLIAVPVLAAVICTAGDRRTFAVYCAFAVAVSLLAGFTGDYGTDAASVISFCITFFQLHLPAVALAHCLGRYKFDLKQTVIVTTAANIIVAVADLAFIKYYHKINMTDYITGEYEEFSELYMAAIKGTELAQNIDMSMIADMLTLIKSALLMFMPAILILICTVMSFIMFKIACALIRNFTDEKIAHSARLRYFTVNSSLSFVTFALILLTFLSAGTYFAGGVYNFALLAAFAYGVNGLAVVNYIVAKKTKSSLAHGAIMILIVFAALISGMFMSGFNALSVLFFAGLLDTSLDFRKIHRLKH